VALPKFEDFKAPWELDSAGNPIEADKQEVDAEKLKKHLYNVLSDKEKAQTARDGALGKVTELTGKVTELETAAQGKANEGKTELEKLQASIDALTKRAADAEFAKDRLSVLTDHKIDPKAHDLLTGKTLDEMKASAERLVELGLVVKEGSTGEGNGGGQGAGQGNPLDTTPRHRLNPGDPNSGDGTGGEMSVDDFVKQAESTQFQL
jgi:hypothetical protein